MAKAASTPAKAQGFSIRNHMLFGALVMCVLVLGVGGWAAKAQLTGAVIAHGTVAVDRHVKKVQHRDGGIVAAINVRNGDKVSAGAPLIRLDDTQIRAEIGIVRSQVVELTARSARLLAERDGLDSFQAPALPTDAQADLERAMAGERRLFSENRKSRDSQREQLALRVQQLELEISGLTAQRDAKSGELELISKELEQVRELHDRKLTPVSRLFAMQREAKRLGGEHGALVAQIARAQGQISEIKVQLIGIDQNVRTEAQRELRTIEGRLAELGERRVAAEDRLSRIELRAPISGVVHELGVHTLGGVVTPAEQLLLIVPESDELIVEAKFASSDIDQVRVGGTANLRLSAFAQEKSPEVTGRIVTVAADASKDERTGMPFYAGRIRIDPEDLARLSDLKLQPGMPVEVFVSTGERTALSYLTKPFRDQMNRAFRE